MIICYPTCSGFVSIDERKDICRKEKKLDKKLVVLAVVLALMAGSTALALAPMAPQQLASNRD